METIVLKFGGSSVADNIRLNIVAEKIISLKKQVKNVVAVVSAQGKTTDRLLKEAQELSAIPQEREVDMLLSTGEQITAAKLSILLNRKGQNAVSLTGWQAGIRTSNVHKSAKIEEINTARIEKELIKGNVVIVAGFQGLDETQDITTLGRGGSDTTAVALQAALKADRCYIFSDVDGIYSADPNMITVAKRLDEISFDEMQEIADAGAKVLHNRCIQIGKKFDCDIIAKSTFAETGETKVCQAIENAEVKSIVKNEKLIEIRMKKHNGINKQEFLEIYQTLLAENIILEKYQREAENSISFRIQKVEQNKIHKILESSYAEYDTNQKDIVKLTIVGYGITQDNTVLNQVIDILKKYEIDIEDVNLTQAKIEILVNSNVEDSIIEELHKKLIK